MSSFKQALTRTLSGKSKQTVEYSSRRAMVRFPPAGKVTDKDGAPSPEELNSALQRVITPTQHILQVLRALKNLIGGDNPHSVNHSQDPHHEIWKPQFSSGDQTDESRLPFFNSGFAACPECGERNVWRFEEKAGIKPNGDTYGTELFICQTKNCEWRTTFKFDDGVPGNTHFETQHWPRGIMKFPVTFMMMWSDKHKLSSDFKHKIFSQEITGDTLLQLEATNRMQELELSKKDAERIRKALADPRGAFLIRDV